MTDIDFENLSPEMADTIREKLTELDKLRDTATAFADGYVAKIRLQYGLLGLTVGVAAGAAVSYLVAYRRAETKYNKIADDEIEVMRQHYKSKTLALEGNAQKRDLDEMVTEKGYTQSTKPSSPPMAVPPPNLVMADDSEMADDEPDDSEMAADENTTNVEKTTPTVRNIFREAEYQDHWDYHEELKKRSPEFPYVIHYDERYEMEEYDNISLTYYEGDDVLCNERDEIVDPDERDALIGDKNLFLFGHGSNDAAIVYVRNDRLELVYEIVQSPNHFAEEVHGFQHQAYDSGNLERMRARERDEQDD